MFLLRPGIPCRYSRMLENSEDPRGPARVMPEGLSLLIAISAGFTGVMISPIHICFVLTCNYFTADIARTWYRLVPPCLGFLMTGCVRF